MNEVTIRRPEPNLLHASGLPLFFEVANIENIGFTAPANRLGQALRTYARSLSVMQKEAVVVSSLTGRAWRLASDEGPYLNGHDFAPCPLSFLSTGMICSYVSEFLALARQRGISIRRVRFIQDNYYTMKGSASDGTMAGSALPVDLEIQAEANVDRNVLRDLALDAVAASPLSGFMRRRLESLFTLTKNGEQIPVGRVKPHIGLALPEAFDHFPRLLVKEGVVHASDFIVKLSEAAIVHNVPGGAASSLQAKQSRKLHLRATCTLRDDGMKEIEVVLFSPIGSIFRFLSDEPEGFGGQGRAPDAATYVSAGIGFCFMTQLGRYAKIVRKDLRAYNIAQDTYFSLGGVTGKTRTAGTADPVETHLYVTTDEDDDFARIVLDMGEQTCFLHALCRSELKTRVRITAA